VQELKPGAFQLWVRGVYGCEKEKERDRERDRETQRETQERTTAPHLGVAAPRVDAPLGDVRVIVLLLVVFRRRDPALADVVLLLLPVV
jgi:hypothetical protein